MVKFRNKPVSIDAVNNDGTDESAQAVAEWVIKNGGTAEVYPVGSVPQDLTRAYVDVRVSGERFAIYPDSWAYQYSSPGVLFTATSDEFNSMFELAFTLNSLIQGESPDEDRDVERRDSEADPVHGIGRVRRPGRASVNQG